MQQVTVHALPQHTEVVRFPRTRAIVAADVQEERPANKGVMSCLADAAEQARQAAEQLASRYLRRETCTHR